MAGVCEVRSEERVHYISAAQLQHYFITFLSSAFRPRSPRVPESVGAAELRTQHMLGARRSHHTNISGTRAPAAAEAAQLELALS